MSEVYGSPKAIKGDEIVNMKRSDWSGSHHYCMVCWIPQRAAMYDRFPKGLQTHELVGGSMRSLEPYNYMRLCAVCHARYHDGTPHQDLCISFGQLLYCKYEWSCITLGGQVSPNCIIEGLWNWHRIGLLYRPQRRPVSAVCLPPMESPADRYLEERLRWNPGLHSPLPLGLKPLHKLDPEAYPKEENPGILHLRRRNGFGTSWPPRLANNGVLADFLTTPALSATCFLTVLKP